MPLIPDFSLRNHNTLKIDVCARYFVEVLDMDGLLQAVDFAHHHNLSILILGEGSNIVFQEDFPGIVIKMSLSGIEVVEEFENYSYVRAAAGVSWQNLVDHTINFHLWGLENLTGIPGTVGAAPVQNIGAYGVELKDVFVELQALDIQSKCMVTFDRTSCAFAYRDSVFKNSSKNRYIITAVTLKLFHQASLVTDYQPLQQRLSAIDSPVTPQLLAQVVTQMRSEKLPHPAQLPNAGSFFKNPLVSLEQFHILKEKHPDLVSFPFDLTRRKLAAAWLIDQCGWKGYRENGVGVHDNQALVLVNYDHAAGTEILVLAKKIQDSVLQRFGLTIEIEPTVIATSGGQK